MREQLSELLIKACGHITSRANKASLIIVNKDSTTHNEDFSDKKTPIVSHDWIYDSIWNFQKLDINDYLV
jgi:fructose-specific component phosphotransferase system IIB-like protein